MGYIWAKNFPEHIKEENINAIREFAKDYNIPFFMGIPQGHNFSEDGCFPIAMGTKCLISESVKGVEIQISRRRDKQISPSLNRKSFTSSISSKKRSLSKENTSNKTLEDIGSINSDDLIPQNQVSRNQLSKGFYNKEFVGYGNPNNGILFYDSLSLRGAFSNQIESNLVLDSKLANHFNLSDMMLRRQLDNVSSIILCCKSEVSENHDLEYSLKFLERNMPDKPVYLITKDMDLPDRFRGQIVGEKNIEVESQITI